MFKIIILIFEVIGAFFNALLFGGKGRRGRRRRQIFIFNYGILEGNMNYKDYFVIDNIAANSIYLRQILDEIVTIYQNLGAIFDFNWIFI